MSESALSPVSFAPSADSHQFRRTLGRFATGVTVVTTATETDPVGLTVNSFASVSLSPPLVLWSPAKSSGRYPVFMNAAHFAIHILAAEQTGISDHFVRAGNGFASIQHTINAEGVPLISGCAAIFECTLWAIHDAGDHSIIVGEVMQAHLGATSALVFRNGRYEAVE